MKKPGDATRGWIHFGLAATGVVLGGSQIAGLLPNGALIGLGIGVVGHAVDGYLHRKDAELSKSDG